MMADFKTRNKNRVAEKEAEQYLERRMTRYIRYGLDCLDSDLPIYKIPALVRSAPDYIIFTEDNNPLFFEAKGFVGTIKIKLRDLNSYAKWNNHLKVVFFLYDVKEKAYCELMFDEMIKIIEDRKPDVRAYPENPNNLYYEIPTSWLSNFTTW
tara:strand:+ start:1357 stop:1815 length:459 start_codon:yes stop_codon:yes gene_type:complete